MLEGLEAGARLGRVGDQDRHEVEVDGGRLSGVRRRRARRKRARRRWILRTIRKTRGFLWPVTELHPKAEAPIGKL